MSLLLYINKVHEEDEDSNRTGIVKFFMEQEDTVARIPEDVLSEMKRKFSNFESQKPGSILDELRAPKLEFLNVSLEEFRECLKKGE